MGALSTPLSFPLGGAAAGAAAIISPTHSTAAVDRLPQQFKRKPLIQAAIAGIVAPLDAIEAAGQQLLTERSVYTATGVTLESIGELVGEPDRNGEPDDTYRRRVLARISTNNSSGIIETLITIARLVLNDVAVKVRLERQNDATLIVHLENAPVADSTAAILLAFLKDAVAGGVRLIVEYSSGVVPFASLFRFDAGPGFDQGYLYTAIA